MTVGEFRVNQKCKLIKTTGSEPDETFQVIFLNCKAQVDVCMFELKNDQLNSGGVGTP